MEQVKLRITLHMTYGTKTKCVRRGLNIEKTHSNDAYCMGAFHPKHRSRCKTYQKLRRNNRILSKFRDAKYIDLRDGSVKPGSSLGCERTNRKVPRNNLLSLRKYRGCKVSKGAVLIRKNHYIYRPGDMVFIEGRKHIVKGVQNTGTYVALENAKPVSIKRIEKAIHTGGWRLSWIV